jgi:hypothetical protein
MRKFRSNVAMANCAVCRTCDVTARQRRTACLADSDSTCEPCNEGFIVTGSALDTCTQCGAGKYAQNSQNTCLDCRNCDRNSRQDTACSSRADRTCMPCGNNRRTTSLNALSCDGCVDKYYSTGVNSCALCAGSNCGQRGQYVECTTTADGMGQRSCLWCEGQDFTQSPKCLAGWGVLSACDGLGTTKVTCQRCPAGTERLSDSSVTDGIQACLACPTGKFKALQSASPCGDCTNKPANSQYAAWQVGDDRSKDQCRW